ncbi:hypothetical protein BD414DRAFT_575583 [Trametes punicea]|nr:hypothetical protein BD414DRAFT_575583 [Trametes punicea]
MTDRFQAACAVLLRDPDAKRTKYITTVFFPALRTGFLADSILPTIFRETLKDDLPSSDADDFRYNYRWLRDQEVDVRKTLRQQREYLENVCNDPSFWEGTIPLSGGSLFDVVEEKPFNLVVILEPRRSAFSQSRPLSPVPEVHDPIKHREKIAMVARSRKSPSTEAQLSQLRVTQTRKAIDAIYNGRPLELLGVSVTIYNSAFTNFLRILRDNELEFTPEELLGARRFVASAVEYYSNENARVFSMAETMHIALGYPVLESSEIPLSSGTIKPDGVLKVNTGSWYGIHRPLLCIAEAKCEIGEGGSDPIAQAERYYRAFYSSNEAQRLRVSCCCPCLLIGIAGPRIMVSGAVFADCLLIQELMDYRSFSLRPTLEERSAYDDRVHEAARLFRAIKTALDDLGRYYASVTLLPTTGGATVSTASPASPKPYIGPQFTGFEIGGRAVTLTYTGRVLEDELSRAVYTALAHVQGSEVAHEVVVKFTHAYCVEGHRLLADHRTTEGAHRPLAPRLWYCSKVPSVGMYVVVMDRIKNTEERKLTEADHATLREAVALLHKRNLVFGDLRAPNVLLLRGGGLMLVDFDWCGREGTAKYPGDINEDGTIKWHADTKAGQLIKKEHDLHMQTVLVTTTTTTE